MKITPKKGKRWAKERIDGMGPTNEHMIKAEEYHRTIDPELMAIFDQLLTTGKDRLASFFGPAAFDEIISEIRDEVRRVIAEIPYIGGDENLSHTILRQQPLLWVFSGSCKKKGSGAKKAASYL
jgi:hypothetical protein